MKFILFTISLIVLLLLPSCENGIVLSYNPDDLESVRFIKSEKIENGNLNCNYGDTSHSHSQGDSYYVYFTLSSASSSPINPENPKFTGIENNLEIEFQKKEESSNNFIKDGSIQVDKIEYLKLGKNLNERQNFNFLIDLYSNSCPNPNDKDQCALSGGLSDNIFKDMLNKIITSLSNLYGIYNSKISTFIEPEFLAVKYMAFSVGGDDSDTGFFKNMVSAYITDMGECSDSMSNRKSKKKIKCWLKSPDDLAYRGLKNNFSKYHRKLWDGYITAAKLVLADAKNNKNMIMFTSGYEESYYESASSVPGTLSESNKSVNSEEDFFNTIKPTDNIPVFIVPENRSDTKSFPNNNGVAPDATDIDNKFYKLACLTGGAYFPFVYKNNSWSNIGVTDYTAKGIIGNIKNSSYGMWRVKITLDDKSSERFYDGGFVIKTKSVTGKDIVTDLIGYRIVR